MLGVFWEMYLHSAFIRMGFDVDLHPDVGSSAHHPDFRLSRGDDVVLVEATVAATPADGQGADRRRRDLYDALDALRSPNFFLAIDILAEGANAPPAAKCRRELERWLVSLDPDELTENLASGGHEALPIKHWEAGEWRVEFMAIPKKPEARGREDSRALGILSTGGATLVDEQGPIQACLSAKSASRYGVTEGTPYFVALLIDQWALSEHALQVSLFGSEVMTFPVGGTAAEAKEVRNPDGYWYGPKGVQNRRLTGVVAAIALKPWSVTRVEPYVLMNPWASAPADPDFVW